MVAGCMDCVASPIGGGSTALDDVTVIVGTSAINAVVVPSTAAPPRVTLNSLLPEDGLMLAQEVAPTSATNLEWLAGVLSSVGSQRVSPIELIDLAASIAPAPAAFCFCRLFTGCPARTTGQVGFWPAGFPPCRSPRSGSARGSRTIPPHPARQIAIWRSVPDQKELVARRGWWPQRRVVPDFRRCTRASPASSAGVPARRARRGQARWPGSGTGHRRLVLTRSAHAAFRRTGSGRRPVQRTATAFDDAVNALITTA